MDSSARRHNRQELLPVRLERGSDEQMVERLRNSQLLHTLRSDKFICSKFDSLLLLRIRTRKHNNLTPHLTRKLNGQMSQSTNPNNAHPIGTLRTKAPQGI